MALVLPALMFLAMGMVEFGQFFYTKNAFQQAARDACRAAIMPNAHQADPYTAATTTLAAAGVTFQNSWMTITDITPAGWGGSLGTGPVSDVSTVSAGHALTVAITTTYGSLPNAVRPLYAVSGGIGIPSSRAITGSSTGLKE
jgi:Flp pilus assembly protein TadG